jgi:hypothetical protein
MTIDSCDASTNFQCKHENPTVCGDNICSIGETINNCPDDCMQTTPPQNNIWDELDRIKALANTNCEQAKQECNSIDADYVDKCLQNVGEVCQDANLCDKIEDQREKERCFSNVAKSLNKPALCENIQKDDRRDSCYVNFAIDGDYSVCEKVTSPWLKKSCETLKQTSQ